MIGTTDDPLYRMVHKMSIVLRVKNPRLEYPHEIFQMAGELKTALVPVPSAENPYAVDMRL